MWTKFSFAITAALPLIGLASADYDLVFPYVRRGVAGEDTDEWKDFHAQVMDVSNGQTTYSVGCATDPCAGWGNLPDFTYTIVIGQNTFDMRYSDPPFESTRTACTFTGSPASLASCEMTNTHQLGTHSSGYEHHFTVPDETDVWNVMSATMRIIDGTFSATSTGSGSGSGSESGSSTPTPTPTSTSSQRLSSDSLSSPTPTSTGSPVITTGGSATGSVASSGRAERTAGVVAPWMLGAGVAAGAVLGL